MIKRLIQSLDVFMQKYTPDPFIYASLLTLIAFIFAATLTGNTTSEIALFWGKGFWSLLTFTMQMVMILFLGYILALSQPVEKLLKRLALIPKNLPQAALWATLVALFGCVLNWGFGLIISALYCKELGKRFDGKGFRVLVACSYSGFLVWHGGFSGSIPLVVSTAGNFSEKLIGGIVPLSETLFSVLNISIVSLHFICLPTLAYILMSKTRSTQADMSQFAEEKIYQSQPANITEKIENNPLVPYSLVLLAILFIGSNFFFGDFRLDLNQINFLLFFLALMAHGSARRFLDAGSIAASKLSPLLIQYPLYAGIMAIMKDSGLAHIMSSFFVDLATPKSLPLLVYYSAGLINIFVPSGGGQWAVQAPMVIGAAQELGANINSSMMAVAWGDAWTNMIQPFWALPLLTIAKLKAKDIMGSLFLVFLLSGVITSACFAIFT